MALTPYKSQQSSFNRSRSSSCSSPIRNRIVYQEIFSLGSNTLVRSYSCDQVFDKDERGRTFQATQIQFASFITPENKVPVDSSEPQVNTPHRSAANLPLEKPEMARKKRRESKETKETLSAFKRAALFILITATSACGFYYFLKYRECSYVWDLEKTSSELEQNIFGQRQAVLKINSVLKTCNSSSDMHVMVFTGGVGVGKTYSSTIISHNFPWSWNRLIIYSEYFATDASRILKEKPSPCGCNLVIVDDLSSKTTKEAINLISSLSTERKNENFLIILIFQSHTDEERNEIVREFKNAYINFHHVSFKPLTKEVVRMCFEAEIQRQGVEMLDMNLGKLVEERMSPINITKGPTGCKGVIEDVSLYFKRNLN